MAEYLTRLIAKELEPEYGSGFSKRQIELFRQFYRTFPIANALRSQLNWTQYRLLIRIDNQDKESFILRKQLKTIGLPGSWNGRFTVTYMNGFC